MRVHDSNLNSVSIGTHSSSRTDSTQSNRTGSTGNSKGSSGTDRISLSDLGSVVRSATAESPERAQKVSQLAAAYKSGSYSVNAKAVSKGIVDDALSTGAAA